MSYQFFDGREKQSSQSRRMAEIDCLKKARLAFFLFKCYTMGHSNISFTTLQISNRSPMKQLKKLYNWVKNNMHREDPQKVSNYVAWLNTQTPGHTWTPLTGFNAITTCYYSTTGQLVFNPNLGTPLKSFRNQATGEIRSFDARFFYV